MRPSFRIPLYGTIVLTGLALALLVASPWPVAAVTPFAVFLAIGFAHGSAPGFEEVRLAIDAPRIVEGDEVTLTVHHGVRTDVRPQVPSHVDVVEDEASPTARRLLLRPRAWGVADVGTVAVRTTDVLGLWWREATLTVPLAIRTSPTDDRLRRVVAPARLAPFVGQHRSPARGDGFELADLRPWSAGDRASAVSWRASARRGSTWVAERHPERVGDVVVLLDTFGDPASGERVAALDRSVRALAAIAGAHERTHDRIGLLAFGGHIRWIPLGAGRRHLARIVDGLLDAERLLTTTWEATMRLPLGALRSGSMLVAVTSLDNDTVLLSLLELRARGFDVVTLVVPGPSSGDERADRLSALVLDARRRRLQRFGVAVADASDDDLARGIEEVRQWRRRRSRSSR